MKCIYLLILPVLMGYLAADAANPSVSTIDLTGSQQEPSPETFELAAKSATELYEEVESQPQASHERYPLPERLRDQCQAPIYIDFVARARLTGGLTDRYQPFGRMAEIAIARYFAACHYFNHWMNNPGLPQTRMAKDFINPDGQTFRLADASAYGGAPEAAKDWTIDNHAQDIWFDVPGFCQIEKPRELELVEEARLHAIEVYNQQQQNPEDYDPRYLPSRHQTEALFRSFLLLKLTATQAVITDMEATGRMSACEE